MCPSQVRHKTCTQWKRVVPHNVFIFDPSIRSQWKFQYLFHWPMKRPRASTHTCFISSHLYLKLLGQRCRVVLLPSMWVNLLLLAWAVSTSQVKGRGLFTSLICIMCCQECPLSTTREWCPWPCRVPCRPSGTRRPCAVKQNWRPCRTCSPTWTRRWSALCWTPSRATRTLPSTHCCRWLRSFNQHTHTQQPYSTCSTTVYHKESVVPIVNSTVTSSKGIVHIFMKRMRYWHVVLPELIATTATCWPF